MREALRWFLEDLEEKVRKFLSEVVNYLKAIGYLLKRKKKQGVSMYGFYGIKPDNPIRNIGDNSIMISMVNHLKTLSPLQVITIDDMQYLNGNGVSYHKTDMGNKNIIDMLDRISCSQILVIGGGGLYQDYGIMRRTPYSFFRLVLFAKLAGCKVFQYAVGVGPLTTGEGRLFTRLAMNLSDGITVRDEESKALLGSLGVKRNIMVVPDPVLSLSTFKHAPDSPLERQDLMGKKVGLSVFPYFRTVYQDHEKDQAFFQEVIRLVEVLVHQYQCQVILLPFSNDTDLEYYHEINLTLKQPLQIADPTMSELQYLQFFDNLDLVVGMRLHSLVFSVISATSCVGISYHPKVTSFCMNYHVNFLEYDYFDHAAIIDQMLNELQENRQFLRASKLQEVDENNKLLLDMVQSLL